MVRIARFFKNIFLWVWRLPRMVTIPAFVILIGLGGVGVYKGVSAFDYMENNPNFCKACHTMEDAWNKWYTSEHKSQTCHDCHKTTIIEGAEQLIKFSLNQPEKVSKHAIVTDEQCKNCHESGNPRWRQVANTAGHNIHAEEQNISCVKCHAVSVHRFAPSKQMCSVCHEEQKIAVAGMANNHCSSCHNFLAKKGDLDPGRDTCLACHKAQKVQKVTWPEDAPMKQNCQTCHKPHEKAEPIMDCQSCHKDIKTVGLHNLKTHSGVTCQTCHQPHEWVVKKRENCLACHADKVQHNPGVTCNTCHNFNKKGGK